MTQIDWPVLCQPTLEEMERVEALARADGRDVRVPIGGGWVNYADGQHTAASPQSIAQDTPTLLTVDGEGDATMTLYHRSMTTDVWSGNTLRPSAVGEVYLVRVTMLAAKSTSADTFLELDLGIGEGWGTVIADERKPLIKGQSVTDKLSFTFPIYCLDTFCQRGGRFYLLASNAVTVCDKAIFIQRTFTP